MSMPIPIPMPMPMPRCRCPDFQMAHLYFSNQTEFDLKRINQEFLLFRKSLNKQSI